MSKLRQPTFCANPFTLLEVLAALTIAAVMMGALVTVLVGAYRLQRQSQEREVTFAPRLAARELLRRDFAAAVPSTGILAGPLIGTAESNGDLHRDTVELVTANGATSPEFTESTADLVRVNWYLVESSTANVYTLVRTAEPTLLATDAEEPVEDEVLQRVASFEVTWYSTAEADWVDTWDSTANENALPTAVSIHISFAPPLAATAGAAAERSLEPLDLIVPFPVNPPLNTLSQTTTASTASTGGGR